MATLITSNGYKVILDYADLRRVRKWKWSSSLRNGRIYIVRGGYSREKRKTRQVYLHRFIVDCPPDKEVLCRNRNRLDCRRKNLVIADVSVKHFRKIRPHNSTGYKGVWLHKGKGLYVAECRAYGKRYRSGYHATAFQAAKAYDQLAREHHGEFARLNFPKARRRHG